MSGGTFFAANIIATQNLSSLEVFMDRELNQPEPITAAGMFA